MFQSAIKLITGWVRLRGNTDDTFIGNKSDRLKVDFEEMQKETYIAKADNVTIALNKSMISLLNDSGSTVIVKLRSLQVYNTATTAITGIVADFNLFRFTGHSAGTSITPLPMDTADSLNSSVTTRTGATITGEAAASMLHWEMSSDDWGTGTLDVEALTHGLSIFGRPLYEHINPFEKPITLRAGEGIHLKQVISSTNGIFDIRLVFTEEAV